MRTIRIAGVAGGVGTTTTTLVTAARCALVGLDARIVTNDVGAVCSLAGVYWSESASHLGTLMTPGSTRTIEESAIANGALQVTTPEYDERLGQDVMKFIDAGRDTDGADVVCLTNAYPALRAATLLKPLPSLWVCQIEYERALQRREVTDVLGQESPFVFVQRLDTVARAFDAGIVLSRWPAQLTKLGDDVVRHTREEASA